MTTRPTAAIDRLSSRYYNEDAYGPENPGGLDESDDGLTAGHVTNFPDALEDVGDAAVWVGAVADTIAAVQSTLSLSWDAATTDANPGAGKMRASTAVPTAGAYTLYVSITDLAGTDVTATLSGYGAGSSAIKGRLRVMKVGNPAVYLDMDVTGVTVAAAYRKIAVTYVTGPGGFATGDGLALGFVRVGDKGDVGGASLPPGSVAAPGLAVTGDSNTGIAQVGGADTLSLVVGGQELARLAAALLTLNPGRAPISPAIWLMGPSVGEDYSFQRDPTGTGYLIFNGVQIAASGYSFRVNNGTERLRIPNTGPLELEATKFRGPATAKQGAIAYAATLTLDFATYQDFAVGDLTGPLTLANPSTYPVGQRGEILLHEDATGGRTVSFGANWIKMGNGTVNTAAGKYSVITYWIVSSSVIIYSIAGGA
ncbi:hypothetical protein ABMY26_32290 [Azospirillum sp. HJ39]|uniref:hypothetical protein n=1 Tax=Azospirillum sp. HJ39 TaxID=3159496 RepID=UPI003555C8C8